MANIILMRLCHEASLVHTLNCTRCRRAARGHMRGLLSECVPALAARAQIGNLQALAQFLSNASKSVSGTLADLLSPARMIIFGTLLTTLNKPMFAATGAVYASFGTVITLYWVTAGARVRLSPANCHPEISP